MASGDGVIQHVHPILAVYVADYPEQILVGGVKKGHCPVCPATQKELDDEEDYDIRDMDEVLEALATADDPNPRVYEDACRAVGIKPIREFFYKCLPYTHIFRSIAPDILHQLYQGVIKHLLSWIKTAFDPAEIDARCRRLPPNHHIRLFMAGISSLSRLTGQEHGDICRILLGLIVDLRLPDNADSTRLICAVRAILDCLYLAQYPLHSTLTLQLLQGAIDRFERSKGIFIDLDIRQHFNINKLHFLKRHYIPAIKLYGTTDNYNTEYTERLHIDLTKNAYRLTNRKDEYTQMTMWLIRREKMHQHAEFLAWKVAGQPPPPEWALLLAARDRRHLQFTKHPTRKAVNLDELIDAYGAEFFREALAEYLLQLLNPDWSRHQVRGAAAHWDAPFRRMAVYHKIKMFQEDMDGFTGINGVSDSIHVKPSRKNKHGCIIPGRFDTVLFNESADEHATGVVGV
jgi:hypothetical protein